VIAAQALFVIALGPLPPKRGNIFGGRPGARSAADLHYRKKPTDVEDVTTAQHFTGLQKRVTTNDVACVVPPAALARPAGIRSIIAFESTLAVRSVRPVRPLFPATAKKWLCRLFNCRCLPSVAAKSRDLIG